MYKIYLTDLPLPYSVNQGLIRNKYSHKYIKTSYARAFDSKIDCWIARHIGDNKFSYLKEEINKGKMLRVDYYFLFHVDRIIWKNKKTLRQLDVDNRIKPLQDAVSKIIGIDDTYFKKGHREIISVDREEDQCAIVVLSATNLLQCETKDQALAKIRAGSLD